MQKGKLLVAIIAAIIAVVSYYANSQYNEITGETQHISMTIDQEIAMGLHAAPKMAQQHGGLHPDEQAQALVDQVGRRLVNNTAARATDYKFDFHLLADGRTVNAFALPGGQVFITAALYSRLENEDQLAGVLGHEVGHVVARHSAQRIAKQKLTQGLTGAAVIATYDPASASSAQTAQMAQMVGNMINMKYGRDDELESDELGVRFMIEAGYNPEALIDVMRILEEAAGGKKQPEFMSTHPSPENRKGKIRATIQKYRQRLGS